MITTILALALMQEAPEAGEQRIDRLCAELASDDIEARETATAELPKLGRSALKAVRRLMASPDAEVRSRARDIFDQIIEPLKDGAVRLEIEIHDSSYRPGETVRFTARLRNAEEFPVQIALWRPAVRQQQEQMQVKQQQRRFVSDTDDFDDEPAQTLTLQAGEAIDVTNQTRLSFAREGSTFHSLDNAHAGAYEVTATCTLAPVRDLSAYSSRVSLRRAAVQNVMPQQGQAQVRLADRNESTPPCWTAKALVAVTNR